MTIETLPIAEARFDLVLSEVLARRDVQGTEDLPIDQATFDFLLSKLLAEPLNAPDPTSAAMPSDRAVVAAREDPYHDEKGQFTDAGHAAQAQMDRIGAIVKSVTYVPRVDAAGSTRPPEQLDPVALGKIADGFEQLAASGHAGVLAGTAVEFRQFGMRYPGVYASTPPAESRPAGWMSGDPTIAFNKTFLDTNVMVNFRGEIVGSQGPNGVIQPTVVPPNMEGMGRLRDVSAEDWMKAQDGRADVVGWHPDGVVGSDWRSNAVHEFAHIEQFAHEDAVAAAIKEQFGTQYKNGNWHGGSGGVFASTYAKQDPYEAFAEAVDQSVIAPDKMNATTAALAETFRSLTAPTPARAPRVWRIASRENPYHDDKGQFTTAEGASSGGMLGDLKASDWPSGQYPGAIAQYQKWHDENGKWPRDPWTPEQVAQARETLANTIKTQEPTIQLSQTGFTAVLGDGTIRNQWETGRSGAASGGKDSYQPLRGNLETYSLGVPENSLPIDRPVYGYFAPGGEQGAFLHDTPADLQAAVGYLPLSSTGVNYADFKNADGTPDYAGWKAAQAAVFMANPDQYYLSITPSRFNGGEGQYVAVDSIDSMKAAANLDKPSWVAYMDKSATYYPLGDGAGGVNVQNVLGFANRSYGATSYGDVKATIDRSLLATATVTGGDSIDYRLMGLPAPLAEAASTKVPIQMGMASPGPVALSTGNYTEVQFSTHPTLENITQVVFSGSSKPTGAVTLQLDARGIPWVWDPMPKLDGSSGAKFSSLAKVTP